MCNYSFRYEKDLKKHKLNSHSDQKYEELVTNKFSKSAMPKFFTFAKEGILQSKTDIAMMRIRTRWANFCQISYFNYEDPPTEENFIDFLSKKKESGRTLQYIAELYATLSKVL